MSEKLPEVHYTASPEHSVPKFCTTINFMAIDNIILMTLACQSSPDSAIVIERVAITETHARSLLNTLGDVLGVMDT